MAILTGARAGIGEATAFWFAAEETALVLVHVLFVGGGPGLGLRT